MKQQILFSCICTLAFIGQTQAMDSQKSMQHWTVDELNTVVENCSSQEELNALREKVLQVIQVKAAQNYAIECIATRSHALKSIVLKKKHPQPTAIEVLRLAMQKKGLDIPIHPNVKHANSSKFSPRVLIKNGNRPAEPFVELQKLEEQATLFLNNIENN